LRILVTGASGFVGKSLTEYLRMRGHEIVTLDVWGEVDYTVDVLDFERLSMAISRARPEALVHLAAIVGIPRSIEDPHTCFRVNVQGTLNAVEAARRAGGPRFIYLSSANVYGLPEKLPVTEDARLNPRSPYDHSKVAAEFVLWSYYKSHGIPVVVFRPWRLFGEHDQTSVVHRFVDACLKNEPLTLYNFGRDTTDPTHVNNLCHAVELSLENPVAVGEAFNIGMGREVSIRDLAEKIRELTRSRSELFLLPPRSEVEREPMRSYPSIEKVRRILGYEPIVGLEEGLERVARRILEEPRRVQS